MGGGQPFQYNAVSTNTFSNFDPKAVSRASLTPKPPRQKQEGPLISFNQHPESTNATPMSPSIKKRISQTRVAQLVFRCFELLGAAGLLVISILVTGANVTTTWIMRIPPGVCILHTIYAIYHLSRRAGGRTPASSASYMLFAAAFDAAIIPFYVFTALVTEAQYKLAQGGADINGEWGSLLPAGQSLIPTLSGVGFLCAVISGGFHLVSLGLGLWLAITFRKISNLPPDMNPLEDNLTSRHHKRNKSSMSTLSLSETRLSEPLESKRNSGAPYEDVSRPPTIPFLATRQNSSVESFSTYHATPPASRDSRADLPSRQYQIPSPHSSISDLKRTSLQPPARSPKQASYVEVPVSDTSSFHSGQQLGGIKEAWFTADSLPPRATRNTPSPTRTTRGSYQPISYDQEEEDLSLTLINSQINPLGAHPVDSGSPRRSRRLAGAPVSALSEISLNASSNLRSADTADAANDVEDLEPKKKSAPAPSAVNDNFKARFYGELRAATPPILIGSGSGTLAPAAGNVNARQVSSGNDYASSRRRSGVFGRRDVSGKVVEEGRSAGWGPRFRKISGVGGNKGLD